MELNEQQGLNTFVFKLVWVAAAVLMTDYDDDLRLNRNLKKSLPAVFVNSHIINVGSCALLQYFICGLQVRWDI